MITGELLEKIAVQKGISKEKLEQLFKEMSEGKENKKSLLESLDEIPVEKIRNDEEMKQVYKKLKDIFEE